MFKASVFGNPIAQSKSPIIHTNFAQQFAIDLEYTKQLANKDDFERSLTNFLSDPAAVGANVTAPFKEQAFKWVDELSNAAQFAGAINTIVKKDGVFYGENTDGAGLVADFAYHGIELKNKSILIIGAGGAVKGVLPALSGASVASITIYNRTITKAQALVASYKESSAVKMQTYSDVLSATFDVVINATPSSLNGQTPALPNSIFKHCTVAYDMVYLPQETAFMTLAKSHGVEYQLDGIGMLIEQAALSFEHWFKQRPDTTSLRRTLNQPSK